MFKLKRNFCELFSEMKNVTEELQTCLQICLRTCNCWNCCITL